MPSRNQRFDLRIVLLILTAVSQNALLAQSDPQTASSLDPARMRFDMAIESFSTAPRQDALSLVDLVVENHWMPPVRQELIWKGLQFAYRVTDAIPPADASKELANCGSNELIIEFLQSQEKQWLKVKNLSGDAKKIGFDRLLAAGILESIPGGAEIVAAKQAKVNESLAANRYVGVGIQLSMQARPLVTKVFYGGSGRKAGMLDGDLILEIDGKTTEDESLAEVVARLRGPEGSTVEMRLKQPDQKPRVVEVVRSVTFIPTVLGWDADEEGKQQFFFPNDRSTAYLRIERIGPSTVHELKQAKRSLQNTELQCLVLDLRSGGGRLHDAVMVADLFLDEGTVGYTQFRDKTNQHESLPGKLFSDLPIIALMGPEMGADRVLLSAAFQDSGEITLVGQSATGPAFVRKQFSLPSGAEVIFPVGILRRGNGQLLCPPETNRQLFASSAAAAVNPDLRWAEVAAEKGNFPKEFSDVFWKNIVKNVLQTRAKR